MIACKKCGNNYKNVKSLHGHIKVHGMKVANYYETFYPKRDKLTGEKIKYKNSDQYANSDFLNVINYKRWLDTQKEEVAKDYILEKLRYIVNKKNLSFLPPNLYFQLTDLGDFHTFNKFFGNYNNLAKSLNIKPIFRVGCPKGFEKPTPKIPIIVDTREQKPIKFDNSISNKLDFGDYTASGKFYSKTFVDRKSEADFKSTFSGGIDRFRREIDRCKDFNSYLFVVVESTIEQIKLNNYKKFRGNRRINLDYVWHNVKDIMMDYDNVQFVFTGGRNEMKDVISKILYFGDKLWNVDVNYYLNDK